MFYLDKATIAPENNFDLEGVQTKIVVKTAIAACVLTRLLQRVGRALLVRFVLNQEILVSLVPRTMITATVTAENDNVYCRFIQFAVVN